MASKRGASLSKWRRTFSSTDTEHFLQRTERQVLQQPLQPRSGGCEIVVVRERDPARQRNPGVLRIDFPRVQVENGGLALPVERANAVARDPVRQNSEVRTTRHGDILPHELYHADRNFEDF